jgi:hypothetical protein
MDFRIQPLVWAANEYHPNISFFIDLTISERTFGSLWIRMSVFPLRESKL